MDKKDVSLYIHIPFCIKRCSYCDFITHTENSNELIERYVKKLCLEIKSYKEYDLKLKTIFFGGGTPSILKINLLSDIFEAINDTFTFEKTIETTIEINPVNLNRTNLKRYIDLGINRISMGVQTFDSNLLKEINRDHCVEDIYKTYYSARDAGFDNFNLDLIFGLPNQTLDVWKDTLEKAVAMNNEHISLYCLDLHDNTPLYEYVDKGLYFLPEESETLKMFEYGKNYLDNNNFIHYEISNWSKENRNSQHNLAYWKNDDYIGVGVSSASYFKHKRFTNTKDIKKYLDQDNFNLFQETKIQSFQEELEETLFMGLRLIKDGLDITIINKRFKIDLLDYYKKEFEDLLKNNLIIIKDNKINLSENSIFISNDVFEKFIK